MIPPARRRLVEVERETLYVPAAAALPRDRDDGNADRHGARRRAAAKSTMSTRRTWTTT